MLASLSATTSKLREIETATLPPPAAPIYCPRYDWIDRNPAEHHAVLDATSMLGAMPWGPEIVAQVMYYAQMLKKQDETVSNIVFMGMG